MKLRLLKSVLTLLAMMPAMTDVWSVAVTWRLLGGRGDHYQLVLHTTQTLYCTDTGAVIKICQEAGQYQERRER